MSENMTIDDERWALSRRRAVLMPAQTEIPCSCCNLNPAAIASHIRIAGTDAEPLEGLCFECLKYAVTVCEQSRAKGRGGYLGLGGDSLLSDLKQWAHDHPVSVPKTST